MSETSSVTARGRPRLWGEWHVRSYQSGTTNVEMKSPLRKPWLYVFADKSADEDRQQRERYRMCEQLAAFLNGGVRPAWLDDMIRTAETVAVSLAGASISAIGPAVDRDPPNLDWVTDESDDAKSDRARLMDVLFLDEGGRAMSETKGRCRSEVDECRGSPSELKIADAIDRLAADVASIKAKIDAVAPEDVRHFVESEKAWVAHVTEQRDAAIRKRDEWKEEARLAVVNRDEARAEVARLRGEVEDSDRLIDQLIVGNAELARQRDEARAEVERLKAIVHSDAGHMAKILIENERLRAERAAPQPAGVCPDCNGEGQHDSGGTDESGKWLNVPCETCRCTGAAPGAPQPAAPPAGWLTEEERRALSRAVHLLFDDDCDTPSAGTIQAILARAGSPPVVEVPAMRQPGPMTIREKQIHVAYRDALDKAGVKWREVGRG